MYDIFKKTGLERIIITIVMSAVAITWETKYASVGLMIYCLFFYYSITSFIRYGKINYSMLNKMLIGFAWIVFVIIFISANLNNIPNNLIIGVLYKIIFICILSIAFVIFLLTDTKIRIKTILSGSIYSSIILCLWIFINEWDMILLFTERIGWSASGSNPNIVGLILGIFSYITLFEIIAEKKRKYIIILFFQYIFMFLTGSKKALISIILGLILLPLLEKKKHLGTFLAVMSVLSILLYGIFNVEIMYNLIGHRVERTFSFLTQNNMQDNSTSLRIFYTSLGWNYWLQSPLFGHGFFAFNYKLGIGTYTHNNYIEILVSHGLLGLLVYYSMYIYLLVKTYSLRSKEKYAPLFFLILISAMIQDFGIVSYYDFILYYIWIMIIIIYTSSNINRVQ